MTTRNKTVSSYLRVAIEEGAGERTAIDTLLPQLGLPQLDANETPYDGINRLLAIGGTKQQVKALKDCQRFLEQSYADAQANQPTEKPKLELVDPPLSAEDEAALDQDELEYRRLRLDLPGVTGAAAQGIVSISVSKVPTKNEFFRTHPTFRPEVQLVNIEVGMEKQYFAVDPCMEVPLQGIGISFTKHILYLTISPRGAIHVIPINCGSDNEYNRTKEIGLLDGVKRWVRLYTDQENKVYRVFPAPDKRFDEPQYPPLSEAKIFRLSFRDKGRLINSTEHELFKKWAAR